MNSDSTRYGVAGRPPRKALSTKTKEMATNMAAARVIPARPFTEGTAQCGARLVNGFDT